MSEILILGIKLSGIDAASIRIHDPASDLKIFRQNNINATRALSCALWHKSTFQIISVSISVGSGHDQAMNAMAYDLETLKSC